MPEFDDTNRGVLFENDKGDNPNRPDYKGTINVDGTEYWLSMWEKTSQKGMAFYSLSVQPKEEQGKGRDSDAWKQAREKVAKKDEDNDQININDIPF